MNDNNKSPWYTRPVTYRDIFITAIGAVFLYAVTSFLVFNFLQDKWERTPIQATSVPSTFFTQQVTVDEGDAGEGQAIFQKKCASCHTIGGGDLVGPDLEGVLTLRERDWLLKLILEPETLLNSDDPVAKQLIQEFNNIKMPNLGLSEEDAEFVLAYLGESGDGTLEPQPVEPINVGLPGGNPGIGENLFIGIEKLQNAGPPCMGCHTVSGVGALGGGTLGPDLTNLYTRYGDAGLAASLQNLPFPTMQGVYTDRPLSAEEVGHFFVFFKDTDSSRVKFVNSTFVFLGLGGFVGLTILSQVIWRKRLVGVRKPLVGR
jgi:mono/diheme cytochrome c family protein